GVEAGGQIVGLALVAGGIVAEHHDVRRRLIAQAQPVGGGVVAGVARPAALRDIVAEGIFDALVLRTTADGGGEMPDELPVDLAECGNLAGARRGVPVSRREGRTAEERTLERNVGI